MLYLCLKRIKTTYSNSVRLVEEEDYSDSRDTQGGNTFLFMGSLDIDIKDKNRWTTELNVGGKQITLQLDTGAMFNVLPFHEIEKMHCTDIIKHTEVPLTSYSDHAIKPAGFVTLPVKYKDRTIDLNVHVVKMEEKKTILRVNICEDLGLVSRVYHLRTEAYQVTYERSTANFSRIRMHAGRVFGPKCTPVIRAPRQIPLSLQDKVKAELDKMEANGVIVTQDQPTPWVNSMVTPIKSNGKIMHRSS